MNAECPIYEDFAPLAGQLLQHFQIMPVNLHGNFLRANNEWLMSVLVREHTEMHISYCNIKCAVNVLCMCMTYVNVQGWSNNDISRDVWALLP